MPKTKWGGAKEPTVNNFYKVDKHNILNILLKVRIYRSQPLYLKATESRHKYYLATTDLGDSHGPLAETNSKLKKINES